MQDLLHVEREEEPLREERRVQQHDHHVGGAQVAEAEDRERDERRGREPGFDEQEGAEQSDAGRQRADHLGRTPADGVRAHDPVGEGEQAAGNQRRAGEVEVTPTLKGI